MSRRASLLLIAIGLLGSTSAMAEPTLGRLFFTPEARAALDRNDTPAQQRPAQRIDGIVRRNNGPATVWIDGQPQRNVPTRTQQAQIVGPDGARTWQKVGETGDTAPAITIERQRR